MVSDAVGTLVGQYLNAAAEGNEYEVEPNGDALRLFEFGAINRGE